MRRVLKYAIILAMGSFTYKLRKKKSDTLSENVFSERKIYYKITDKSFVDAKKELLDYLNYMPLEKRDQIYQNEVLPFLLAPLEQINRIKSPLPIYVMGIVIDEELNQAPVSTFEKFQEAKAHNVNNKLSLVDEMVKTLELQRGVSPKMEVAYYPSPTKSYDWFEVSDRSLTNFSKLLRYLWESEKNNIIVEKNIEEYIGEAYLPGRIITFRLKMKMDPIKPVRFIDDLKSKKTSLLVASDKPTSSIHLNFNEDSLFLESDKKSSNKNEL